MDKKISIIIPCYNVEKYIDRCLESLVSQTIGINSLELICVDDCSTDDTWAKLQNFEQRFSESVIIIHNEENGRQGMARNIGLQYASAPYIGFVDADDWLEIDMYEKLYQKMISHDADIVMCDMWRDMDRADQVLPPKRDENVQDKDYTIDTVDKRRCFIASSIMGFGACNKIYKAEIIYNNQILFPEKLAYEDHYFAALCYFYAEKIYVVAEKLYHYFVNTQSTIMTDNAVHHFDILKVDILLWDECEDRGLLELYRAEVEYQFLSLCYLTTCKMLLLRFDRVPYDFFMEMKAEVLKRVPNYRNNRYVSELVTDTYKIILELLERDVTEAELNVIFASLRGYVNKGMLRL